MGLTEAIIIKTQKYKEDSKIVRLLTEEGVISSLGRGCLKLKSKNFYLLHEITKIEFDLQIRKNSFNIIKSTKLIDNYSTIKTEPEKVATVLEIFEIVNIFAEHISDYKIFYNFLSDILNKIKISVYPKLYKIIFKIKILYLLGVAPEFTMCVNCGNKNDLVGFDFESGGMKCNKCCSFKTILENDIFIVFKKLYLTKLHNITDEIEINNLDECDTFINYYYSKYLGYNIKTTNVFKKINNDSSRS